MNLEQIELHDFATSNTLRFFSTHDLDYTFLQNDPELWEGLQSYDDALKVVENLRVTNDNAEHGVALIQEYNQLHTKDEHMNQYLLQVVQEHRKKFPSCSKSVLSMQLI